VDPAYVPSDTKDELRALEIGEKNITYFTGHAALAKRPTLPRHGREDELLGAGYMMLVPSYESLKRSLASASAGIIGEDIPIWLSLSSVKDRTLVPPGSEGESLYFMLPVCPYDLADGRDWADEKQAHLSRCLDIIDTYAAGVKDSVIDTHAISPYDMSKWVTKGHACHIDMSLGQMGPWRPTPSLSGYQTPIDDLWQVSAGSHPLPSVNGWAGRTAARTMLKADEGRRGRRADSRRRGDGRAAEPGRAPAPVPAPAREPVAR